MQNITTTHIIIFLMALVGFVYLLFGIHPSTTDTTSLTATVSDTKKEARQVPDGWREYKNDTYHFSLLYPEELEVKEYREGDTAITITFQNSEQGIGFQVFAIPYGGQQISDERFKKDIPSGVRVDVVDTTIDGALGAAFYSTHTFLGETREVWFLKNGWLYEISTLKSLDTWLEDIMATWKFI
jgi:hypothetical protein